MPTFTPFEHTLDAAKRTLELILKERHNMCYDDLQDVGPRDSVWLHWLQCVEASIAYACDPDLQTLEAVAAAQASVLVTLRCYLRGDFNATIEQLTEQTKEMTREWGVLDVTASILKHEAAVAAERA